MNPAIDSHSNLSNLFRSQIILPKISKLSYVNQSFEHKINPLFHPLSDFIAKRPKHQNLFWSIPIQESTTIRSSDRPFGTIDCNNWNIMLGSNFNSEPDNISNLQTKISTQISYKLSQFFFYTFNSIIHSIELRTNSDYNSHF